MGGSPAFESKLPSGRIVIGPCSPTVATGPLDRLVRHETYSVNIQYKDGSLPETYTETVPSESAFQTWAVGEPVTLMVRNMGTVAEVQRKKK